MVLAHPKAGRGQVARHLAAVLDVLRPADPLLVPATTRADAIARVRRAVDDDAPGVVAVGGDGTAHLAVQAVAGTAVPLGLVPLGTGNDLADAVGVPADPPAAARAIVADVEAGRTTAIDAVRVETPALLAAIGNTRSYGGGMRMCPAADPTDGLLDVTVVEPVSRLELIRVKPRLYSGAHVDHPAVRTYRAASIHVDAPGADVFADGEPSRPLPVRLTTAPKALRLVGAAHGGSPST